MSHILMNVRLFAALCLAAPAAAAPADADPKRIVAAEQLLHAMNYDAQLDRTVEAVIAEMGGALDRDLAKADQPLPPALVARIKSVSETHMRSTFREHRQQLKRGTVLIYARHFTVPELKRLTELQSDPVMAKMQAELPQIAAESMALSQAMSSSGKAALQAEIKAIVEEHFREQGGRPTS